MLFFDDPNEDESDNDDSSSSNSNMNYFISRNSSRLRFSSTSNLEIVDLLSDNESVGRMPVDDQRMRSNIRIARHQRISSSTSRYGGTTEVVDLISDEGG